MSIFKKSNKTQIIYAPCSGIIHTLESLKDGVFSEKIIGDGIVIKPTDGRFIAPISGELLTVFHTGHAYGIKNDLVEILVHIGLETVALKGEGFTPFVVQHDQIKVKELMVTVDLDAITKLVPTIATSIIILNDKKFKVLKKGKINAGDPLLKLI